MTRVGQEEEVAVMAGNFYKHYEWHLILQEWRCMAPSSRSSFVFWHFNNYYKRLFKQEHLS